MAEITPDSSLAEVINSLDLAGVPEKLHCSTCHGFLLNAYKTSCCEQNVCEKCFHQITDHCPMCKHRPFSKELCRPAKAMRNTVKAYLRSVEKSLVDERAKAQADPIPVNDAEKPMVEVADAQAEANREVENGTLEIPQAQSEEPAQELVSSATDIQPSIETGSPETGRPTEDHTPQIVSEDKRQISVESDANDDEVEIQVEPSAEDVMLEMPQNYETEEQDRQYDNDVSENSKDGNTNMHDMSGGMDSNGFNAQNMGMMGFNNVGMDMNMMQQMMNINQMMAMGMNPMFGSFGGANGNMNGMNMLGYSNQMFNGWNGQNNMWQNNNGMNAMGGEFGSNMSQQGNFYPQQFPNGDFNGYNGRYGRGRGRGGRGAYGRGRGSYNQYQQNSGYHNAHEQQQYEVQHMQTQITHNVNGQAENTKGHANQKDKDEEALDQDDFAPGGQDEVQEALGDDDRDSKAQTSEPSPGDNINDADGPEVALQDQQMEPESAAIQQQPTQEKIIPEAYHEDFENMAPPSAPTGPSGRYSDKEFAFRARGHGKYSSRGRGSFSTSGGFPASPIRSVSQTSITAPSPPSKGVGVVGAPTGPRAMREPAVPKPAPRPLANTGGFQIMGRASMQSQTSQSKEGDRPRSASPANGYDEYENDKIPSRRHTRYDKYGDTREDADSGSNYDHDKNDKDRERKNKHSKRADYKDDYEMEDADQDYDSPDRKSSRRSSRYEKDRGRKEERYSANSKHRSSRRHYDDEAGSDYEKDGYGEPVVDKHRSSRSGKPSSKYDGVRDREAHRERKRERDRDRDRDEDRSKEKEDRHRKRSRHDRDHEDEYDDPDDEESRHRSRRHKKDHHSSSRKDRDKETEDADLGLRISGRSNSNRHSALPTPTSATSSLPPALGGDAEKDPHTLEREARNRERMQKEQQRREKAALDKRGSTAPSKSSRITTSGGRRVSYKYEDEVERGMGAADEREKARWR